MSGISGHELAKEAFLWAMGGKVNLNARETWSQFLRLQETEFYFSYDWIRQKKFYLMVYEDPRFDFGEGAQGMRVWTTE